MYKSYWWIWPQWIFMLPLNYSRKRNPVSKRVVSRILFNGHKIILTKMTKEKIWKILLNLCLTLIFQVSDERKLQLRRLSLRSTYFQIFRIFNSKQFFCSNLWNMLKSFDFVQVFKNGGQWLFFGLITISVSIAKDNHVWAVARAYFAKLF